MRSPPLLVRSQAARLYRRAPLLSQASVFSAQVYWLMYSPEKALSAVGLPSQ